jgi:hypothetical protein
LEDSDDDDSVILLDDPYSNSLKVRVYSNVPEEYSKIPLILAPAVNARRIKINDVFEKKDGLTSQYDVYLDTLDPSDIVYGSSINAPMQIVVYSVKQIPKTHVSKDIINRVLHPFSITKPNIMPFLPRSLKSTRIFLARGISVTTKLQSLHLFKHYSPLTLQTLIGYSHMLAIHYVLPTLTYPHCPILSCIIEYVPS